jgi:ABC-2 type transport system ATP-binding protein
VTLLFEAQSLSRFYGDVVGLSDLSIAVEPGVVGLLGPNGAGKSTLLKLLVGEIVPSRGSIRVLGRRPFADRELFARLGFSPQQDALYGDMSGFEFVHFLLRISGFSPAESKRRAERALERVQLTSAMHQKTRGYSKGMRQRVKIAQAIAHDPELVVLDEPLSGLDPLGRRDVLELFRELARGGTSIVLSSHVLHEVEALTEDILLLHRGRMLAQGRVSEVRALLDRHPRKVEIKAREPRKLAGAIVALDGVRSVKLGAPVMSGMLGDLSIETSDLEGFYSALPAIAVAERAGIQSLEATDAGLEAVFDYLVESGA